MLKTYSLLPGDRLRGKTLIKRRELRAAQSAYSRARQLERSAEACCERMREQAHREANAVWRSAAHQGVALALAPMLRMLDDCAAIRAQAHQAVRREVREAMREILAQEPVLVSLVETVLARRLPGEPACATLTVPPGMRVSGLVEHCAGVAVQVREADPKRDGDDLAFRIEWGEHRWEAVLDDWPGAHEEHSAQASAQAAQVARSACAEALRQAADALEAGTALRSTSVD